MIQCKECGFMVNELMRFALMKNVCPSCGSGLLSDKDSSVMSVIQGKLASQRFASSFTETQIYDISLFIFNELNSGLGGLTSDAKAAPSKNKRRAIASTIEEDSEDEFLSSEGDFSEDDEDLDLSSIRKEVESEFSEDLHSYEGGSSRGDEDVSSKAERLKKLYEQRALANGGSLDRVAPKIKRGGFKGITRST